MTSIRGFDTLRPGIISSLSLEMIALIFLGALALFIVPKRPKYVNIAKAPVHGYASRFEPSLVMQMRFVTGAKKIIADGYKKFKDVPFIVRRFDTDYNILPIRYLQEIGGVSPSILNGTSVTAQNMLYEWTDLHFLHRSKLHAQVLKRELAPRLSYYLKMASEELSYGWNIHVPQSDEWVEVDIQDITRKLVVRMNARMFLGVPACRDAEWLMASEAYTVDAFTTAFILRMLPTWLRPLVARFLPSRHRLSSYRSKAKEIVRAKMERHAAALQTEESFPGVEERTLLDWMIENGTPQETELAEMANRQCIMTLASIHTTSMNTAIFLYELCAHPEWIPVLREEIMEAKSTVQKETDMDIRLYQRKLDRMDSFLMECFRTHPPILLSPQRVALQSYTLRDGTHIPKGSRISFAMDEHQNDPQVMANPTEFYPMRSYNKRQESEEAYQSYQSTLTDCNNLTFGYGNQACPGRFLGVAEIKLVLTRLLTEFDFKFPDGKTVPKTLSMDENVFIEPGAKLMMRRRAI